MPFSEKINLEVLTKNGYEDIGTGMTLKEVEDTLDDLCAEGEVEMIIRDGKKLYRSPSTLTSKTHTADLEMDCG